MRFLLNCRAPDTQQWLNFVPLMNSCKCFFPVSRCLRRIFSLQILYNFTLSISFCMCVRICRIAHAHPLSKHLHSKQIRWDWKHLLEAMRLRTAGPESPGSEDRAQTIVVAQHTVGPSPLIFSLPGHWRGWRKRCFFFRPIQNTHTFFSPKSSFFILKCLNTLPQKEFSESVFPSKTSNTQSSTGPPWSTSVLFA